MVINFIEDNNINESGVVSDDDDVNCFGNSVNNDGFCDLLKRNLLADVAKMVFDKNKRRDEISRKMVVDGLLGCGYAVAVCKSRWDKTSTYPAGEYEYIDAMIEEERLIIDIDFRSEFEIARSTKSYKAVLQTLPQIFVGKPDRLQKIINIVSDAAKQSLKKKGMPLPPWRRADYVKAKWLSPCTHVANTTVNTDNSPAENQSFNEKATKPNLISDPKDPILVNELEEVGAIPEEEKSEEAVKKWEPVEIKPKAPKTGGKVISGLASVLGLLTILKMEPRSQNWFGSNGTRLYKVLSFNEKATKPNLISDPKDPILVNELEEVGAIPEEEKSEEAVKKWEPVEIKPKAPKTGALSEKMFTLEIHHNGQFTSTPGRIYLFGDIDWFDGIHCDVFSLGLLGEMLEDLGYTDRTLVYTHFRLPGESLDDGLLPLKSDEDVKTLLELYIETGVSIVEYEMMDQMMTKGKGVVKEEIVDDDVNEAAGKGVDGDTGNNGKLLFQPDKAGPVYDSDSDNGFPPTFSAGKMIANHSKRLSDEFEFRRLLVEIDQEFMGEDSSEDSIEATDVVEFDDAYYDDTSDGCTISGKEGDLHTWISDQEVEQGKDVDWTDDPYHLVDVPEPEEMHAIEEPQEPEEPQDISDMFAEIDQALDELDDVVVAGEGTEVYAIFAEPISFSLVPLVVVDDQCVLVVGNEGCMPVIEGDVIKDKEVAKQGDEPVQVLEKNGVGQDGVIAEDKFEDQGRSIKRRRLMADKKPKVAADKKPKDDADKNPKDDAK
ncbi:PDDEXK-like protein [Artemisia annua]|uniref:PDDEXK-like protein n=1 Tax=Artemisia annua TaxID=35608 RepID=A0A2U1P3E7_ARTAN|nr:PDDEXK-like protein [Artemisia annua]